MDVLKPPIVRIGNRCYRVNPSSDAFHSDAGQYYEADDEDVYDDEVCDEGIEECSNGFRCSLQIPNMFFKYIIGKKGETRKRLEGETRTQIKIPRQGEEGDIVITGRDQKGVASARNRINIMIQSARQRQPFTHFLSLPITESIVKDNFKKFKDEICQTCNQDRGVESSIFQNPNKLHLTLGTLVLPSEEDINEAHSVMLECQSEILQPLLAEGGLAVSVQGLEYMNDEPAAVDVLYAQVQLLDGSDRLQNVADGIVEYFTKAGLMFKEYDKVKLHITVMNTLFRKDPSGAVQPTDVRRNPSLRESFDATNILQMYKDYSFGEQIIDSLHLSTRYSTGPDGYYEAAAKIRV